MAWEALRRALLDPRCQGAGPIQLVAQEPFWDEADIPFTFEGGGTVARIVPSPGFRKESLAGSPDERALVVDCPDDEGWLVPEDVVSDWMARNVSNAGLDDLLLSHPLYEYLTRPDPDGLSRAGTMPLVQWAPGIATLACLHAPEFVPDDDEAPRVNRQREAYADAVVDLLREIEARFPFLEAEVGLRYAGGRGTRAA